MENGVLVALISKLIDRRIADLPVVVPQRGPRGHAGSPGADGRGFVFSEHESTIREWAKEFALKFEDFTAEQIEAVRGPRGKDGADGRDFDFAAHSADIEKLISEAVSASSESFKLKFADLSADEVGALRGPRGETGRSFIFEEHKDVIEEIIRSTVGGISESLKLKFSDLTADDIGALRGPRGHDGRPGVDGKSFDFEEHRTFFEGLKPKFADFTSEERESLRLRFSHLSEEEKSTLKLRFEDLTENDRALIRGARGPKGQKGAPGRDGIDGKQGLQGARGVPGMRGIPGTNGKNGRDGSDGRMGVDGKDAPYVTDIELEEYPVRNEIAFVFKFSDGSEILTDTVKLPQHTNIYVESGGGGGGGGQGGGIVPVEKDGTEIVSEPTALNFTGAVTVTEVGGKAVIDIAGSDGKSAYEIAVEEGFVGTEEEWLASLVGPEGPEGPEGPQGPAGEAEPEGYALINNNQASPTPITGFILEGGKSFMVHMLIQRTTDSEEIYATEIWLATALNIGWRWTPVVQDEVSGVTFTAEDDGQIEYTSTNQAGTPDLQKVSWKFERIVADGTEELNATIENDQATPVDVVGMIADAKKSQMVHYYVERDVDADAVMSDWATLDSVDDLDEVVDIRQTGIAMITRTQLGHCRLTPMFDDGMAGVTLSITNAGQFQYVSTDVGGDFPVKKIHWKFFSQLVG